MPQHVCLLSPRSCPYAVDFPSRKYLQLIYLDGASRTQEQLIQGHLPYAIAYPGRHDLRDLFATQATLSYHKRPFLICATTVNECRYLMFGILDPTSYVRAYAVILQHILGDECSPSDDYLYIKLIEQRQSYALILKQKNLNVSRLSEIVSEPIFLEAMNKTI